MSYLRVFVLAIFTVFVVNALAQSSCGPAEIAIDVIQPSGAAIEGLAAADFSAEFKRQALTIQSLTYDSGPRRILIVMDETRDIPAEGRKAQMELVAGLIAAAQPADSLALLTARGAPHQVKFGADRSALLSALGENTGEQDKGKQLGVLDAVAEGITWFGEPRLGDTIVVLALDTEGNRKTNYSSVAKMLEEHRIRLFGVAFGHLILTNLSHATMATSREGFGYVQPGMPLSGSSGDANFLPLSVNSGGYVIPEDAASKRLEFKVTDSKKEELRRTATAMARLIDNVYAVRLQAGTSTHAEPWSINLSHAKSQALPGARILYPHELIACAPAGKH